MVLYEIQTLFTDDDWHQFFSYSNMENDYAYGAWEMLKDLFCHYHHFRLVSIDPMSGKVIEVLEKHTAQPGHISNGES